MRSSLIALVLAAVLLTACSSAVVKQGDTVSVTYTGTLQNGSIFDSNDPAHQSDLPQKPVEAFAPMTVAVGQGRFIPGFENALVGMKEGETKTVTIKAADAYGPYVAELVTSIPKSIVYNRTVVTHRDITLPTETLQGQFVEPLVFGQVFETRNFIYNVTSLGAQNATLRILSVRNDTVTLEQDPWPSVLVRATDSALTFRRTPLDKALVQTPEGPYIVHLEEELIRLETALQVGQEYRTQPAGYARVTQETQTSVTLDRNHPLAGRDLTFAITVDAIEPKA